MAESQILDAYGRPIRRQQLLQEAVQATTTGVHQAWAADSIVASLDPARLRSILQGAAQGEILDYLVLAEEMEEKDPHYAAVLGTRKRAVSGLPVGVEAASDAPRDIELADAVRELTEAPEFGDLLDDLLDAIGKGFSVAEPIWQLDGAQLRPVRYEWRDPRWFQFDKTTGRTLLIREEGGDGREIPPGKLLVHQPRLKSGLPIRGGVARLVAVSFMCKAYGVKDWMRYVELFGMPLRIGRYGPGAKPDDIAVLRRAVAQLAADAAAILPEGMKIEFEEIANAAGGAELFERLAEWLDKQISKAVLGQTMTTDDGSSQSQANVHNDVRMDILKADAKQLAATLNRDLVRVFVDLNFGPQERYPRIVLQVNEPEDLKALAGALTPFIDRGLAVEQSVILDRFGLPAPAEGAELLRPQGAQAAPPAVGLNSEQACRCGHCSGQRKALNAEQPRDALDDLVDEAAAEWQPVMRPLLDPLQQLAEQAQDFDEFRARLPELLEQMDDSVLIEQLARAAFRARGMGDATDEVSL
jgi:phage gp29-like protein